MPRRHALTAAQLEDLLALPTEEESLGVAPVAGVDRAHGFAPAAGKKVLAIRAGNIGGPEQGGE